MSNEAITWAFKQDLPMTEKFVLVALADYADENQMCYPSHKKTAARIGASPDTVKRATRRLDEKGYLSIYPWKRDNGSSTSNRYKLNVGGAQCTPGQTDTQGGYVNAGEAPGTSAPPNNPQLNPHLNQDAISGSDGYTDEFEAWWKLYPSTANKAGAFKAYKSAAKKYDDLDSKLRGYLNARTRQEKSGQFVPAIPNASTWLNQERWNDYGEQTTITLASGGTVPEWSKDECDAILGGSDHWVPGTPPAGMDIPEEMAWTREQYKNHLNERRRQAWEVTQRG